MPAEARGHVRKWQLRYYDAKGGHRSGGAFSTKSEAWAHYRDVVEPELHGRSVARRDLTLSELVDVFLERHGKVASRPASKRSGGVSSALWTTTLADLEHMTDEIAAFAASLPNRFRYSVMSALRQAFAAGVRYGHMTTNPAKLAGAKSDAVAASSSCVHAEGAREDHQGTRQTGSCCHHLRGGHRATPCGVGERGAARRREESSRSHGARHKHAAFEA